MTEPVTAKNINDFSLDDREHIKRFLEYGKDKIWRDDTAIMLPSGQKVYCKSLVALVLDEVDA